MLCIGKFCDFGAFNVAAFEDFLQIHFGHTAGCVLGVVIVLRIDHHAVQHGLHFGADFVQQMIEFTGLNELSNVVVGVEAFACCQDALANFDGHRRTGVVCGQLSGCGHMLLSGNIKTQSYQ